MKKVRRPYKVKRKNTIFKNRVFWESLLLFLAISFLFYFLFFSQTFQLNEIYIFGNKEIKVQNVQVFLKEEIKKTFPSIFTVNILLVNSKKLEKKVLKKFPEIDTVKIYKKFPNVLDVQIKEREAVALFCKEELICGFLDKKGIIFKNSSAKYKKLPIMESSIHKLPLIISLIHKEEIVLGEIAIKKEILKEILKIRENLEKKLKLNLEEYVLVKENKLNVKTSQNWKIYFNLERALDVQFLKLNSILEKEISLKNREKLEYIDLTLTKVYYKYRD